MSWFKRVSIALAGCTSVMTVNANALNCDPNATYNTYADIVGSTPAITAKNLECMIDGASGMLTIPAGDYLLAHHAANNKFAILTIDSKSNLTINANNVKFVFTENRRGMMVKNANAFVLKGLELDYDPLPFTQGTITAVGANVGGKQDIDIDVHAGYDVFETSGSEKVKAITFNQNSHFIARGSATRGGATVTNPSGNILRINSVYRPDTTAVGNFMVVTKPFITSHTLIMKEMTNSRLQNVKIRAANVISILDTGGSNNKYINVKISQGSAPSGASEDRLIAGNAGGIIVKHSNVGPQIRNSTIENIGDDGINIHGEYYPVYSVSGGNFRIITRTNAGPNFKNGDTVYVLDRDNGTIKGSATVTIGSAETTEDYNAFMLTHWPKRKKKSHFTTGWDVTLSPALVAKPGDAIFSPDRAGRGYKIIHNTIKNSRARGILSKAPDGLILANTIDHMGISGIVVASEQETWLETSYTEGSASCDAGTPETPEGLRIVNNKIIDTGFQLSNKNFEHVGGIAITGPDELPYDMSDPDRAVHKDVEVRNNTFDRITGVNLAIRYADCVSVKLNKFKNSHIDATESGVNVGINPHKVVDIDKSTDVHFLNNKFFEHANMNELDSTPFIYTIGVDTDEITGLPGGLTIIP